ncbi:MAG TPA: phosphate--acyl-ACP acyltransferase, partial [Blastocatellia bacterium]|nr:phosphate--acyl-ACP acyltransferase [Blastocatellia bacterium]
MLKIAVDAMGGDFAPANEVQGALEAARDFGVTVILVGRAEQVGAELAKHSHNSGYSSVEIVDAREVISMDDSVATAVRRKRNSSIRVAAQLVRGGDAQALVSAGNT